MPEPTPTADPPASTTPPQTTPPAATPPAGSEPAKFDQSVLENPELWKQPRIAQLLESDKAYKKMLADQEKQTETQLTEQKKFEELAAKRDADNQALRTQLQTAQIDTALTGLLIKDSVVDLTAALKLVDRSKLSIDDSGNVTGVDEALASLKENSPYLFTTTPGTQPKVGTPTNPANPGSGAPAKFKASQMVGIEGSKFYRDNKAAIDDAYRRGEVENDV